MWVRLAWAALTRRRARTALAVVGVAVSAALLLDMVMLATGMRESFRRLLISQGLDVGLAPKGTLPFDTEATIDSMHAVLDVLRMMPAVARASPVLGGQIYVQRDSTELAVAALGVDPAVQADYRVEKGGDVG